jgi:hypothetical protein
MKMGLTIFVCLFSTYTAVGMENTDNGKGTKSEVVAHLLNEKNRVVLAYDELLQKYTATDTARRKWRSHALKKDNQYKNRYQRLLERFEKIKQERDSYRQPHDNGARLKKTVGKRTPVPMKNDGGIRKHKSSRNLLLRQHHSNSVEND